MLFVNKARSKAGCISVGLIICGSVGFNLWDLSA